MSEESYQALYRRWRPMTFDDVVGQKHVTDTLKTAVASGRISHAYLFCGTRGTGKTSTAKIFSRAVNCENPQNGEPCNQCASCRGILSGAILDVYEMDAASNRGVENIREIRDEIMYTPAGCTYKVYIIDEVHMLTAEAFNALLKTLEEPPEHTLFVLATTEPHKIPATVLSRCQRFDFRRIGVGDIARRLDEIIKAESIAVSSEAIELIAELGDGSMRDALSILDQCAAFGLENLTVENVTEIVGIADPKSLFEITNAIADENTEEALLRVDSFLQKGKEAQNLLEELIEHFKNLLICKSVKEPSKILERSNEMIQRFQNQAEKFMSGQLIYAIRVLSENLLQAKWMSMPQIAVETAVIKLCTPSLNNEPDALLARIEKLERIAAMGGGFAVQEMSKQRAAEKNSKEDHPPWKETEKPNPSAAIKPEEESAQEGQRAELWEYWQDALQEIKKESKSLFAFLYNSKAFLRGDTVELELTNPVAYDRIAKPEGLVYLSKLFSGICGKNVKVAAYLEGQRKLEQKKENSILDLAEKKELLGDKLHIIKNE
ncbi:DNA polymerase III subunit gamma/tau [Ructibacterium gallinarum]|uniref:DNA-directed DNA polymerase n=1 Tax=Ructibacterium gallinarum TaxID=2779355 RepID=A0A9D5M1D2_9FIRM|nr:DNA polymerase III subunit gamma/tau [Ructibacterium gallinarum]MBE5039638.1 DNA polymerase III subunit gamma/tau [Ructibacterium gallinarum]